MALPVTRPCFVQYKFRTYLNGQFEENLVYTEFGDLRKAGIAAISTAPTAAIGSSTGITATNVRYAVSYAEKQGSVVVHESDLSDYSTAIPSVNNQSIEITGLPTSHTNIRATHKRLYREDNSGLTRHVADIVIGTSTYTDTTPTLSLGAIAPENHGVPPYTKFNEIYHDIAWYAGDKTYPFRLWRSEVGKPEAVGALSYIDTLDGEAITGIKRLRDTLLVFCATCVYIVTGFSSSTFAMEKIEPNIGCISHHSIVNIEDVLWFASESGVYTYDGSFRYQMKDLEPYWRDDYSSNIAAYQDSIAIDDRFYHGYMLLIPKSSAFYYFGHYDSVRNGSQPDWVFDVRTRKDLSLGLISATNGANQYNQFVGSADGYIRQMNVASNADDDSDTNAKRLIIQTGANFLGKQAGIHKEGKKLTKFVSYVESESNAWTLYLTGGDEDVVNAANPDNSTKFFKEDVAASASGGFTKKSTHNHSGVERVSGNAFCVKVDASSPSGMKFRGYQGVWVPGEATRPAT